MITAKRFWCVTTHVWFWRKYEIVGSSTDRTAIGRIYGQCSKCGEMWKLWPAKYDLGKWMHYVSPAVTIYADFNARTPDDRVRLTTVGSQQSLANVNTRAGDLVWLSDCEVRAVGRLQVDGDGALVAEVFWDTIEPLKRGAR